MINDPGAAPLYVTALSWHMYVIDQDNPLSTIKSKMIDQDTASVFT